MTDEPVSDEPVPDQPPPDEATAEAVVLAEGVDYAWSRPNISQLAALGKQFACRYGGPGSAGKQLDPGEAQALSNAGIAVVANAEGAADGLLGGWNAGVSWARDAQAHFAACGMPSGRPIYFSVDFDVQSRQWPAVASALRGAASVVGASRVGVYGGRRAMEWARRDGVAAWFWQTFAWSGGVWVPGNHIEQYRIGVVLAGATVDLNRALAYDIGQWKVGDGENMGYDRTTAWRLQGYLAGDTTIVVPQNDSAGSPPEFTEPNMPQLQWDRIEQLVTELMGLRPIEIDYDKVAEMLRPIVAEEAEAAVRRVLSEATGGAPDPQL